MNIHQRLQQSRKKRGFARAKDASDAFGWKYPTYAGHENGSRGIKIDEVLKYSSAFSINPSWLAFGDAATQSHTKNFPIIQLYDVQLSAGAGTVNYEEADVADSIPFTADFLSKKLHRASANGLICCYVNGESMSPTLEDGDMVIVDTKIINDKKPAGIYALNYGEESYVKRVEKINSGYALFSDNPTYETIHVRGDEVELLHFIGKVVWSGGVHR